jgi:DNA polymerase-3 subunit delta
MITTLAGANDYQRKLELNRLVNDFSKLYPGGLSIERFDGEDDEFGEIKEALQSLPFLSPKKLIILSEPAKNKRLIVEIDQLLKKIDDRVEVVIIEPKIDKRSSFYKFLKANSDYHEFINQDLFGLSKWIESYTQESGGHISASDAQVLIERVGAEQIQLKNELDKLILFDSQINQESIMELTEKTPQSSIFELIDAAINGDKTAVIRLYDEQKSKKVEPQQIIALISWQLHILALIKTCPANGLVNEIIAQTKLNPFVVRKNLTIAKSISLPKLRNIIDEALRLDIRLKTENINGHEAIEYYLISLLA